MVSFASNPFDTTRLPFQKHNRKDPLPTLQDHHSKSTTEKALFNKIIIMASSANQQGTCIAAAIADLRQVGVTFPEATPQDCGSNNCRHCTALRRANATSQRQESEAQRQQRSERAIEEHFEDPQAGTIPALYDEDQRMPADDGREQGSVLIPGRLAEERFDEFLDADRNRELDSINETMWAAAREEEPQLLQDVHARRAPEGDHEMVDLEEAQIGLEEIDEARVEERSEGQGGRGHNPEETILQTQRIWKITGEDEFLTL